MATKKNAKKTAPKSAAPKSAPAAVEPGWEDVPSQDRLEFMALSEEGECHVLLGECREQKTKYGMRTVQSAQLLSTYVDAEGVERSPGDVVGIFHSADLHRLRPFEGREVKISFVTIGENDRRIFSVRAKKA